MSKLELDVPKDAYNITSIDLESGRCMYIIVPSGIGPKDAARAVKELDALRKVMAGWQSN